ncbi:hypothetical protein [Tenacibaculum insulae]|uniref:hypothetical protein n=1 Tax=Tenacibaculum insulae TaxID=2029677 RepID=UPI003AB23CFE
MKKYSFLISFFFSLIGFSQNYEGTINTIQENGLHKMMLTSAVRAASNENFDFLRVMDTQKNEIPYVLIHNNDTRFSNFKAVKISSKKVIKDSITSILINNQSLKKQDYVVLKIANTKIKKNYTVFGSDNQTDWFGLVANKNLADFNTPKKTSEGKIFLEKTIHFPLNTYKFLRINFDDKNSLPINILSAGVYESTFFTQKPIELKNYKEEIITIKEKKVTQLKFTAKMAHKINAISFKIATDFYLRDAKLIVNKTRKIKKREESYNKVISQFKLNSKNNNTFTFSNLNEKEFIIEISNQDNLPLQIETVQLLQKPIYLIANLKQKQDYKIVINNTLSKPFYDLGNFISNKTPTVKETTVLNFSEIKKEAKKIKEKSFLETKLFMWVCIVLGGVLVVYFAVTLLKDINLQEKK